MLVLVIDNCQRFFAARFLSSALTCLFVLSPLALSATHAQDGPTEDTYRGPTEDTYRTTSVLEGRNDVASANQAVSINDDPFQETRTSGPSMFPEPPLVPKSLAVPASPNQESFTNPRSNLSVNELRGNSVRGAFEAPEVRELDQDRSDAIGTLATSNQSFQVSPNQQSGNPQARQDRQQFTPPAGRPSAGRPLTPQNFSAPKSFQPPAQTGSGGREALSSRPTPMQTSRPVVSPVASASPSEQASSRPRTTPWENSTDDSSQVGGLTQSQPQSPAGRMASNSPMQSSGQTFNAGANSNYNRGLNRNTASGTPSIQPQQNQNSVTSRFQSGTNSATAGNGRSVVNRDSQVRPTGFASPVSSAAAPRKKIRTDLAKELIARYRTDNVNPADLPGKPVKLVEMLSQPISTVQRRPMVHQFWDTYFDWASLVNSREYLGLLENIQASAGAEQAMLQTAKMVAQSEVLASEIQLVKSQAKLNQFVPNQPANQPLLIPNDMPLIQAYKLNYELYKQNQLMPASLLGIDKMLPKTLELVSLRAETVQVAQRTNQQVASGLRNRQVSLSDALMAAKQWRSAEQSLLVAVTDYNHAISDYSLTVAKGYYPPQDIVAMLIGAPKARTQNLSGVSNRTARNTASTTPTQPQGRSQFDGLGGNQSNARSNVQRNPVGNGSQGRPQNGFAQPTGQQPAGRAPVQSKSNFNLSDQGGFTRNPTAAQGTSSQNRQFAPAAPVQGGGAMRGMRGMGSPSTSQSGQGGFRPPNAIPTGATRSAQSQFGPPTTQQFK